MGQALRKAMVRLDFFSAPTVLRSQQEAKVSSVCLGIFSTILFILCGAILVSKLRDLFIGDSSQIKYSSSFQVNLGQKNLNNIMLGVIMQTGEIKVQEVTTYFDVYVSYYPTIQRGVDKPIEIGLVPCTSQLWQLLGQNYQEVFQKNNLTKYLCLPSLINVTVDGDYKQYLNVSISPCSKSSNCKSLTQITQLYNKIIQGLDYFPVSISYLAPFAELSNKQPLQYKVEQKIFAASKMQSQLVLAMVDTFLIQIDKSVWPIIRDQSQQVGYRLGQMFYSSSKISTFNSSRKIFNLAHYITKNKIVYSQSFNKIDQILSYVGGLLGILGFFLIFLLKTYNEYRFELLVAENSFNFNSDGFKIKQDDFNLFVYFKFRIYFWIFLVFGKLLDFKKYKQIQYTLQEGRKLLEVSYFFRRIEVLERLIWKTNNRNILMVSALRQYQPLSKVQNMRLTLSYFNQIIEHQTAATVQDALVDSSISFKYLQARKQQLARNKKQQKQEGQNTHQNYYGDEQKLQKIQIKAKQQLMKYLKLQDFPQVCQKISYYTIIAEQAQSVQLQQQFQQIEQQITNSFINLQPLIKYELMQKIPIKIIYRLLLKAKQMEQNQSQNQKKTKKQGDQQPAVIKTQNNQQFKGIQREQIQI